MKTKAGFFGVYPTVYALFDDQGNLARDPMRRQVQSLLEHKVHGIGVLGLASEVNKLSTAERRQLMEWVAEDVDGKVPLTMTIAEASVSGQIEFVRAAAAVGAKWAILQPPPVKHVPESELIRFFWRRGGRVADPHHRGPGVHAHDRGARGEQGSGMDPKQTPAKHITAVFHRSHQLAASLVGSRLNARSI